MLVAGLIGLVAVGCWLLHVQLRRSRAARPTPTTDVTDDTLATPPPISEADLTAELLYGTTFVLLAVAEADGPATVAQDLATSEALALIVDHMRGDGLPATDSAVLEALGRLRRDRTRDSYAVVLVRLYHLFATWAPQQIATVGVLYAEQLVRIAHARGGISPKAEAIILHFATRFGMGAAGYFSLKRRVTQPPRPAGGDGATVPAVEADEDRYGRVLGLSGTITREDVRRRYREAMRQYHPDRVAAMGPEIVAVAQRKAQEINEAYSFFRTKYGF